MEEDRTWRPKRGRSSRSVAVSPTASHRSQQGWRDKRSHRGSQVGLGGCGGAQGLETGRRAGRSAVVCENTSALHYTYIKGVGTEKRQAPGNCLKSVLAKVICDYCRALLIICHNFEANISTHIARVHFQKKK